MKRPRVLYPRSSKGAVFSGPFNLKVTGRLTLPVKHRVSGPRPSSELP